ncbi:UNVERIFIED_CONTAM: rhoptry protein ROP8 [Hammondia hammondi]|eukprot:XP_008886624.1 rhoptry protein ROP8 [Hammondia hammondi]
MAFSFDAWTLGLAIYWIWCADLPNTEDAELGGTQWIYRRCRKIPQRVKALLEGFLRYSKEDRLLPLQAMETPEYEELRTELASALPRYQTDGEPAGEGDAPPSGTSQPDDTGAAAAVTPI